jgi:hypothetical protein
LDPPSESTAEQHAENAAKNGKNHAEQCVLIVLKMLQNTVLNMFLNLHR